MRYLRPLYVVVLIAFGAFLAGELKAAPDPITLRVALYPYVPGAHAVFALLAREFQRSNPGITLELVELGPNEDYYGGDLQKLDADVLEIDSILLSDMIAAKKISPLPISLDNAFSAEALEAVTRSGTVYAAPHWLCGNFLFYRKGDLDIRDAATWSDLLAVLAKQKTSLVFDLYGRLTLGEWYITFLADRVGPTAAQAAVLASAVPNDDVILNLRQLLTACPEGMCRSKPLHDRTGFYARAFVRGEARGYIGYSESLHYGLQEAIDNCGPGTSCISPDEIAVRRLPSIKAGQAANGIGWVDGLAISAALPASKKEAAQKFVAFATSAEGYQVVLQPLWMEAPRYLLPARTGLTFDDAPLYPAFLAAHAGRHTGTQPDLNKHLQDLSGNLNCALPIDRTDTKSLKACKKTP